MSWTITDSSISFVPCFQMENHFGSWKNSGTWAPNRMRTKFMAKKAKFRRVRLSGSQQATVPHEGEAAAGR
jgi:hypothetical protein